jgi:hypothetical protein
VASFSSTSVYAQDDDSIFTPEDSTVSVFENNADEEEQTTQYPDVVVLRSVPDSTVERTKKDKAFAYANDAAYWVKEKKVYRKGFWDYVFDFFTSSQVRILFYVLLIGLAIFVMYRVIVLNNLLVFKRKGVQGFSDDSGAMRPDRDTIDANIQEAINQKNFQIAVRYLYLKTLYELSDRNLIHFHPEATNNQYLNQMSGHKKNKNFQFLTQVYEYIWYGKFQINEQQFSLVHDSFKNFHTGL